MYPEYFTQEDKDLFDQIRNIFANMNDAGIKVMDLVIPYDDEYFVYIEVAEDVITMDMLGFISEYNKTYSRIPVGIISTSSNIQGHRYI